ncbi:MAG TPA: hypothetical protein VF846_15985 [Thermoanaerobaculia bacterium]
MNEWLEGIGCARQYDQFEIRYTCDDRGNLLSVSGKSIATQGVRGA